MFKAKDEDPSGAEELSTNNTGSNGINGNDSVRKNEKQLHKTKKSI